VSCRVDAWASWGAASSAPTYANAAVSAGYGGGSETRPYDSQIRAGAAISLDWLHLMQGERFGGGSGIVEDVAGEDAEVECADGGDA